MPDIKTLIRDNFVIDETQLLRIKLYFHYIVFNKNYSEKLDENSVLNLVLNIQHNFLDKVIPEQIPNTISIQ